MFCLTRDLHEVDPDLAVAVAAARRPARIIRKGWAEVGSGLEVTEKSPGDVFTECDVASDRAIHALLRKLRPGDGICSEELAPHGTAKDGRLWVIDPLDASVAFTQLVDPRMPATLVALEVDSVVKVSAVCFPVSGETFFARKGGGAFRSSSERLSTTWASRKLAYGSVVLNSYPEAARQKETEVFARLRERLPRAAHGVIPLLPYSGISVRIASGNQDEVVAVVHDNNPAYPPKQCLWDVAAVRLVLEEAGGVVVNVRGEPYNPRRHEPFVCAANQAIADQIIALL